MAWLKPGTKIGGVSPAKIDFLGERIMGLNMVLRLTCLISQLGEDFWSKNSDFEHLNWRI